MTFFEIITQIDQNLQSLTMEYPFWIYSILFLVIFIKTGIGFLSFVPGESLLVAVGVMASQGYLEAHFCLALLSVASFLGCSLNYIFGKELGLKTLKFKFKHKPVITLKHIEKTQKFYEKHGAKTLIFVRFVPMFRSLAPFIAGMSKMKFSKFLLYNMIGGFLWVMTYLYVGYFFGNIFKD